MSNSPAGTSRLWIILTSASAFFSQQDYPNAIARRSLGRSPLLVSSAKALTPQAPDNTVPGGGAEGGLGQLVA
jgi:hypothetical protein